MRAAWMLAAILSAPAAAADQFDLVCKAKSTTVRYRIDLARGEWCEEFCRGINQIANATTGKLTLKDIVALRRADPEISITIDRMSGAWRSYQYLGFGMPETIEGTCQSAPFSGFPQGKF